MRDLGRSPPGWRFGLTSVSRLSPRCPALLPGSPPCGGRDAGLAAAAGWSCWDLVVVEPYRRRERPRCGDLPQSPSLPRAPKMAAQPLGGPGARWKRGEMGAEDTTSLSLGVPGVWFGFSPRGRTQARQGHTPGPGWASWRKPGQASGSADREGASQRVDAVGPGFSRDQGSPGAASPGTRRLPLSAPEIYGVTLRRPSPLKTGAAKGPWGGTGQGSRGLPEGFRRRFR